MDPALTAAAIGVGGTVIVGVAGFWASVRNTNKLTQITEQGQVTDRYSKAIEQLGSDKLDVRIGGIYALERIARDSPRDHPTIMEVLAAFIREHSREPWPWAEPGAEPPERTTRPDVRAAATVIGRRTVQYDSEPVNLADVNLTRADLAKADLTGADLTDANLTDAILKDADLTDATLRDADLTGADLTDANLSRANLYRANLTGVDLIRADLTGTTLISATLTGADLTGADLIGADLTGANLYHADLTGADWPRATPVPQGWQPDTESGRLTKAARDSGDAAAG